MKIEENFNLEDIKKKLEEINNKEKASESSFKYKFLSYFIVLLLIILYDQVLLNWLFKTNILNLFISLNFKEVFYIILFFVGIFYYFNFIINFIKLFIKYIKNLKEKKKNNQ